MADSEETQENTVETESTGAKIKRLEGLLAEKDEALGRANASIAEMRKTQAGFEGEVAELKQKSTSLEGKLALSGESLKGAVESFRTLLIKSNPGVPEELIGGDSVESVGESLEKAKALVSRVRQGLETEIQASRVPLGAPARSSLNLSSLSPREKISYAMGRNT